MFNIPETMFALQLFGAGIENLKLNKIKTPINTEEQLLVRMDAVGLCASDYKIILQGEKHPRMIGEDLKNNPPILGHEVCFTIVIVGKNLEGKYNVGDKWTLQPDIKYQGKGMPFGYKLKGGLAQYQVITKEVIDGGYLIPIDKKIGYSQCAIAEPWACVFFSYRKHRDTKSVKKEGVAWYIGAGALGLMHIEKGIMDGAKKIIVSEANSERLNRVKKVLGKLAKEKSVEIVYIDINKDKLEDKIKEKSVDDIFLLTPNAKALEEAMKFLAYEGYVNVFAGFSKREYGNAIINLNDMHYNNTTIIATSGSNIEDLKNILGEVSSGKINPNNDVAAVGGINASIEGMEAVNKGSFPGRIVIYPNKIMELKSVDELTEDGIWSKEAEEKLLGKDYEIKR